MISLLAKADALVIRPPHAVAIKAGDPVDIIRLTGGAVSI
jgi:molybdopterin biosynthesis enzyme